MAENNVEKKKKSGIAIFFIILVSIIIILALGLLIRLAIVQDGDYFAPVKKVFGMEGETSSKSKKDKKKDNEKDIEDDDDEEADDKNVSKTSGKLSLLSSSATAKGVNHYNMKVNVGDFLDMCFDITDDLGYETKDLINLGLTYAKQLNLDLDLDTSKLTDNDIKEIEDGMDEMIKYAKEADISVDLYSKENELVQVVLTVEYGDLLEKLYNYVEENESSLISDYDDYDDFYSQEIEGKLDKDVIISSLKDALSSQGMSSYISEFEDDFDFAEIKNGYEFYFTFNKDINDYLANAIDEYADELKEMGIDAENVIEGVVDYINENIDQAFNSYGINNIFSINKVK